VTQCPGTFGSIEERVKLEKSADPNILGVQVNGSFFSQGSGSLFSVSEVTDSQLLQGFYRFLRVPELEFIAVHLATYPNHQYRLKPYVQEFANIDYVLNTCSEFQLEKFSLLLKNRELHLNNTP
jgi:hypothetical protein